MSNIREQKIYVIKEYARGTQIHLGILLEKITEFEEMQGDAMYGIWDKLQEYGFDPDDVRRFHHVLGEVIDSLNQRPNKKPTGSIFSILYSDATPEEKLDEIEKLVLKK